MKLTGLLVVLLMNKRRNIWPLGIFHMLLLDTDLIKKMFFYDWLSSKSYSSNTAVTPFTLQHFYWKFIALSFISECGFKLGTYQTYRKYKFGEVRIYHST